MCIGKMAEAFDKSDEWDPITGKVITALFKNDSQNAEALGKLLGWRQLENDAKWNQQNPEEGIAQASVATGMGFLGNGLSSWLGGGSSGLSASGSGGVGAGNAAAGISGAAGAGAGGLMGGAMTAQNAMKMMELMQAMQAQQQPQQGLMAPPPRQSGQMEPLPMMEGYTPGANSLGTGMPTFESEAERRKRKLKMMRGY